MPTDDGLIYHQIRVAEGLLKVGDAPVSITLPHVPPGRYGVLLEGGVCLWNPFRDEPPDTNPFAFYYTELEMPDADSALELNVKGTELSVELTGKPDTYPSESGPQVGLCLDRIEPLSTGLGGGLSNIYRSMPLDRTGIERFRLPFLSQIGGFSTSRPDRETGRFTYRPVRFPVVSPGRYRLTARIGSGAEMFVNPEAVFFTKEFTVPPDQPTMRLEVPYPASREKN